MGSSVHFFLIGIPLNGFPLKVKNMFRFRNTPYFVTDQGEVYREGKDKPLKPDVSTTGYHRVTLSIDGITERFLVHRMVAETYLIPIPGKEYVNHIDNNTSNNTISNLEWCTRSENMLHSHRQNRCSNIIASRAASKSKTEQSEQYFQKLLGSNFLGIRNENPRNYVLYRCCDCGKEMSSRTDSEIFKKQHVNCRRCSYRRRDSLFSCESMRCICTS